VQVLRPGPAPGARLAEREARRLPALAAAVEVTLPSPQQPVVSFEVDADPAGGPWLVLRVSDPAAPPDPRATGPWAELGYAIAYASPFWLETG
jgi:aminoglycoside phosphotransferase (APT) family kinase protein